MLTWCQLIVMGFNEGIQLEQPKTQAGDKKWNLDFSKTIKPWSSKPFKKKKDRSYLHRMVNEKINCVAKEKLSKTPTISVLSENILSIPKPERSMSWKINYQELNRHIWLFVKYYIHANIKNIQKYPSSL